jgi:sulfur carrier protein ThiS
LKIQVESLGLSTLSKLIGRKTELEVAGGTVADLVAYIVKRHGRKAHKILLDDTGELDMTIQVMVNDEGFVPREEYSRRPLKEGDQVKFMLLVGGG